MPLLLTVFGFAALAAVIVNKAMSLVVVAVAIPARLGVVPLSEIAEGWTAVVNLLAGSLLGAWLGASWATRMASATLYRVLSMLLVLIAVVLPQSGLARSRQGTSRIRSNSWRGWSRASASAWLPRCSAWQVGSY